MKSLWLLALIVISGLFYFSEGKPCPEKTRPHKSRCDAYFKCVMLPSKSHVWVPEKCEQGLIYEPNLQMCVLPGDDWECTLGDSNKGSDTTDDNVVYGVGVDGLSGLSDPDDEGDDNANSESDESASDEIKGTDYISVESGSENDHDHELEASGDGAGADYILLDTTSPESKTNDDEHELHAPPLPTKFDPNLTAHLQRLSQLIDGLKQTYQSKDSAASDMRPDQLNAFLAHYNIKAQMDSLNPAQETTTAAAASENQTSSTTPASTQLDPETKVVLTNQLPSNFYNPRPTDGYSNSQIVVNKPEGSVLFTLGNQPQDTPTDHRYDPKISEETLKTVLELSKQMIENQNVRRILPNAAYYPQVVQPIYLPAPVPPYGGSIYHQQDGYDDKKYDKVSSTYYVPQEKPEKPATTIIHNNVIPVHVSSSASDQKSDSVDSYGLKLNKYPPLSDYHYNNDAGESSEIQDHKLTNRYENNQLVTARPNIAHQNYNNFNSNYQSQQNYRQTTTYRPYISDSGSTLTDYYTPSPHLDETNVNTVFQVERYPTINYGNVPPPRSPSYPQPNYNHDRPDYSQQNQQYQVPANPYQNYYQPNRQQSILQLFPSHIDSSKVKIRPNSQKLESMEQETAEDNDDSQDEDDQPATGPSDDNHSETYNQYSANKQFMSSQLAQYVEQLNANRPQKYNIAIKPSRSRLPSASQPLQHSEDESQLVGLNENVYPYELFPTNVLTSSVSLDDPRPELGNCPVGVRQPNATDCTKYYVCSRENGNVMPYSCPLYTAFNPQTRICDAHYYAICYPGAVISRYTVSENRRIQIEAIKALQDAKRIREQALKAQKIALRLRFGDETNSQSTPPPPLQQYSADVLSDFLHNAIETNSLLPTGSSNKVPLQQTPTVTQRPHTYSSGASAAAASAAVTKKRKYYCKEGDKVADQTSIYNYFVCYKNSQGMMKGHKMTCSQGLLFCPMTRMCTLSQKCT